MKKVSDDQYQASERQRLEILELKSTIQKMDQFKAKMLQASQEREKKVMALKKRHTELYEQLGQPAHEAQRHTLVDMADWDGLNAYFNEPENKERFLANMQRINPDHPISIAYKAEQQEQQAQAITSISDVDKKEANYESGTQQ